MKKKSSIKKNFVLSILAIIAIVAGAYFVLLNKSRENFSDLTLDRFYTVRRDDMTIGVFLSGNINAKQKYKLALDANFRTTLTWIVPENSAVKKGDEIARFEADDLNQKIEELELSIQNLEKEREIAIEEISIQKSVNEAQKKIALDNLAEAEGAFVKYRKLEGPKDDDTQNVKVEDAAKLLDEARKNYEEAVSKFKQTVFMEEESRKKESEKIATLEKKVQTEEINYNNAILDRKIFKRFVYPNKLTQLANKVEQEKLNLNKTSVTANSQLLQKENQLAKIEAQIKKVQYDLDKHKSFLSQMKLVAPIDGIVTYSDSDRRWGAQEIKVGMEVRPKDVLVTIPEMSALVVDFDLPEQYRAKVKVGDKTVIQPDSLPGLKITGRLSSIAPTPVNQIHWDRNSPKIYPSKVEFDEMHEALVSGMSVRLEIITDTLRGVLFVPVEAVFDEGGKFFVYLNVDGTPEIREVEIGASNDYYVEIKKGLKEGEVVYLYRPFER